MEFNIRNIDIFRDREFILDCHCRINFECDSEWAVLDGYEAYARKWFSTNQPNEFYQVLIVSMTDSRNIAVVCEIDNVYIGYLWVRFTDVGDYNFVIAEIDDIIILDKWKKKGFATQLLTYAENRCEQSGATVLRSATGANNIASINLHKKTGFKSHRLEFEKLLSKGHKEL